MERACTHICFYSSLNDIMTRPHSSRAGNPQKKVGLLFQVWVSTVAVWFPDCKDLPHAKMLQGIFLFFPQNQLYQNLLSKFTQAFIGPRPGIDGEEYTECLQQNNHGSLAHQPVAGQMGWPQCWAEMGAQRYVAASDTKGGNRRHSLGRALRTQQPAAALSLPTRFQYLIKQCGFCLLMSGGYLI